MTGDVRPDPETVEALTEVIRTERERHVDQGPEQMVFNVRCICGHIGQQVSVAGEFEAHVDGEVARAILAAQPARDPLGDVAAVEQVRADAFRQAAAHFRDASAEQLSRRKVIKVLDDFAGQASQAVRRAALAPRAARGGCVMTAEQEVDAVVELMGRVHVKGCASIPNPRMVWAWEGRNKLPGDKPCADCLPCLTAIGADQ